MIAGAANAQATGANRERGFSVEAYLGLNETTLDEQVFLAGAPADATSIELTAEAFGAAAMYRVALPWNLVGGLGGFIEGQSAETTLFDTTQTVDTAGGPVEQRVAESVDLGLGYGARGLIGYAFEETPVMIYVTGGWGRLDFTKLRTDGLTTRAFEDTFSYYEIGAGVEYDFAPGASIVGEAVHREYEDFTVPYAVPGDFAEYSGDALSLRIGVRYVFGG